MEVNWWIVALMGCCAIVLIAYLLRQNCKDKKEYVRKLNEDYKKREVTELNDEI